MPDAHFLHACGQTKASGEGSKLTSSWRSATSSLENVQLWLLGRGCSGTSDPAQSLGIPLSTTPVPTCSLAAAPPKQLKHGEKRVEPECALPSPLKQQLVSASPDPDLDELCHTRSLFTGFAPAQQPSNLNTTELPLTLPMDVHTEILFSNKWMNHAPSLQVFKPSLAGAQRNLI